MATEPDDDAPVQTRVETVTIVTGQLIHARGTHLAALCVVGAILTLVPQPWAALSVALCIYVSVELLTKVTRR